MASKRPKYPTIPLQKVMLVRDKSVKVPEVVNGPWAASVIAKQLTDGSPDESLIVFCLNGQHELISAQVIATGAPDHVACSPSQVFRAAIVQNAAAIIVAHNHPSGSLRFSDDDRATYRCLVEASRLLGIHVFEFILVVHNRSNCLSMNDGRGGNVSE